jgi:hypothetical protein
MTINDAKVRYNKLIGIKINNKLREDILNNPQIFLYRLNTKLSLYDKNDTLEAKLEVLGLPIDAEEQLNELKQTYSGSKDFEKKCNKIKEKLFNMYGARMHSEKTMNDLLNPDKVTITKIMVDERSLT